MNRLKLVVALGLCCGMSITALAQQGEFRVGEPLGAVNEAGERVPLSDNVRVYGSFRFSESCTFDPQRNLILAMNRGMAEQDGGYVSLLHPDGSLHTAKWIGVTRDGLTLNRPLGSAIRNNRLYTVDMDHVRIFDLATGQPLDSIAVPGATLLNGIGVSEDGTVYASNTPAPERIFRISADGDVSVMVEGAPLDLPNGVAVDNDGNVVVVNIGDNAVLTFAPDGSLLTTEYAAEPGNDGVVVTEDGTLYVSSVRHGSISRIRPGQPADVIATGIPSAASMCYDSVQRQLVIPMNDNDAMAFVPLD